MQWWPAQKRSTPHLLVNVLQQGLSDVPVALVLRLLFVFLLRHGVSVSEVGLGVDVVEAGPGDHQLPVQQLDVLEEGQALPPLPPGDLLALHPTAGRA